MTGVDVLEKVLTAATCAFGCWLVVSGFQEYRRRSFKAPESPQEQPDQGPYRTPGVLVSAPPEQPQAHVAWAVPPGRELSEEAKDLAKTCPCGDTHLISKGSTGI